MTFEVVRKRRVIDLAKTAVPKPGKAVPANPKPHTAKQEPELYIRAAPDGPPIAAELPEKLRKIEGGPIQKPLTEKQTEILNRIIQKAGDGHAKTLGLRLVLAASEDELAAAWPIGLLSKALRVSGRPTEADAVHLVAQGCRIARFKEMAAAALAQLNQKIEAEKAAVNQTF